MNIIPSWASTLFSVFDLGGFQLLIMGLIGEYIGILYIEVNRGLYLLSKRSINMPQGLNKL